MGNYQSKFFWGLYARTPREGEGKEDSDRTEREGGKGRDREVKERDGQDGMTKKAKTSAYTSCGLLSREWEKGKQNRGMGRSSALLLLGGCTPLCKRRW